MADLSTRRGYAAAILGTVIGGVIGLLPGVLLLRVVECDADGLACLGHALTYLAITVFGALVGGLAGCYAALRIRRHTGAGTTTALLALLVVPAWIVVGLASRLFSDVFGAASGPVNDALFVAAAVAMPLVARLLALRLAARSENLTTRQISSEDTSSEETPRGLRVRPRGEGLPGRRSASSSQTTTTRR